MIGFAVSTAGLAPAGQQALAELNQEMLGLDSARHSGEDGLVINIEVDVDPAEAERKLQSSPFGKVLLSEGRSLLRPYKDPSEREDDLIIGESVLPSAVELTASSRVWRSTPPFTASGPLSDYVQRSIGIGLWYGEKTDDQKGDAAQYVGAGYQFNTHSGQIDSGISRRIFATRRLAADRFYFGHNEKQRSINDKKLLLATQTARELFDLRPVDEPS
ncbi:MAG TPA: hypothetical protein VFX79_03760 [Candidatus Saccharimonadales bacterium]|nr:hypothetical protein [Candidatus Saccharimonadales bacterium]